MIKNEQSKLAECLVSHSLMLDDFTPSPYDTQYNLETVIKYKVGLLGLGCGLPPKVCMPSRWQGHTDLVGPQEVRPERRVGVMWVPSSQWMMFLRGFLRLHQRSHHRLFQVKPLMLCLFLHMAVSLSVSFPCYDAVRHPHKDTSAMVAGPSAARI